MINHRRQCLPPTTIVVNAASPLCYHHHCVHTRHHGSHTHSTITITIKQADWTERGPK
jgi:hypothetical protein